VQCQKSALETSAKEAWRMLMTHNFSDSRKFLRRDPGGWLGRKDSNLGILKVYLFELSNEFAAL